MDELMPTMKKLQHEGVAFTNCYTAATLCSPSRASFLTGVYPSVHGVTSTPPEPRLPTDITNIFKIAESVGYEVAYKGKMHMFTPTCTPSENVFTPEDIDFAAKAYKFRRWNPPDDALTSGGDAYIAGGTPNNDERFLDGMKSKCMTPAVVDDEESILDFLDKQIKNQDKQKDKHKPFLLVCSFGNPHDISVWPWQDDWGYNNWERKFKLEHPEKYKKLNEISLPSNFYDNLQEKPVAQSEFVKLTNETDPCDNAKSRLDYCRFYAYLHHVVDQQIHSVLRKLDEGNLRENTAIFRFADHGELGQSHGMIQKGCNSYQETINVPLIVSYPGVFPPGKTDSFASLIDLVPTISDIIGCDPNNPKKPYKPYRNTGTDKDKDKIKGYSLKPILEARVGPRGNKIAEGVRKNIMFFTEDLEYFFKEYLDIDNAFDTIPGKIRGIRTKDHEGDWMYAVYFNNMTVTRVRQFQYEMYNLDVDPGQLTNLACPKNRGDNLDKMRELHHELTIQLKKYNARPIGWPDEPVFDESEFSK
jgi:arylsulfatase A-like enzyme